MSHVCDSSCAHTVDVGYVHVLVEPGGECTPTCPHPAHASLEGTVMCPAIAGRCICRHELGHEPPHECADQETCDGAWTGDFDADDGTFEVHRLPNAGGLGPLLMMGVPPW